MNVTKPHEHLDIWFMWMLAHWISKKITVSNLFSAANAAICASPPSGPERNLVTVSPAFSTCVPVVPVDTISIPAKYVL